MNKKIKIIPSILLLAFLFITTNNTTAQEAKKDIILRINMPANCNDQLNTRVAEIHFKSREYSFSKTIDINKEYAYQDTISLSEETEVNLWIYRYRGYDAKIKLGNKEVKEIKAIKAKYIDDIINIDLYPVSGNRHKYLFYSRDLENNKPYRIPAIAQTPSGTLLALSDYRPCGNDIGYGEVDIKIRRCKDLETWSEEETVADGKGEKGDLFSYGFGDAAIVADRESEEVLIMCVAGKQTFQTATRNKHNHMARIRSHNGGLDWSEPEDVTSMFMDVKGRYEPILPEVYSMFFASGRILQSKVFKAKGSKYYRLYAALLTNSAQGYVDYVVYSDDFGETWYTLGEGCVRGGDEAKVEELSNGNIVISSRKPHGRYYNIFTFTDIALAKGVWSEAVSSDRVAGGISVGGNSCNGEILKINAIRTSDNKACELMLQSLPTGNNRTEVSIFFKELDNNTAYTPTKFAEHWEKGMIVSDRGSAYSTMILQDDGRIGFLYEEEPNDYCIVYISLSIEEITNGKYK